jgi:hypothetical protein
MDETLAPGQPAEIQFGCLVDVINRGYLRPEKEYCKLRLANTGIE